MKEKESGAGDAAGDTRMEGEAAGRGMGEIGVDVMRGGDPGELGDW